MQETVTNELIDREDFIDLFRAGNEEAEIALWDYGVRHYVRINRYLRLAGVDAYDVWMEVYLDFFETRCPTYDKSIIAFKWWARMVVKRAGWRRLREQKAFRCVSLEDCEELRSPVGTNCENESGESESEGLVKHAIKQLSETYQSVLLLRFDEELSNDLIAERLGITECAVAMRVSRGLQKLRQLLKGWRPRELHRRRKRAGPPNPRRVTST